MSKIDFMNELERLLFDIPIEERKEALQYYNDYFVDAGEDHEEEILKELVSPQRVASIIKANLNDGVSDPKDRGYFTEKGYQDTSYEEEKFELVGDVFNNDSKQNNNGNERAYNSANEQRNYSDSNQNNQDTVRQNKNPNIALIILLCIFAIPIGLPLVFSIFGVMIGVAATIIGLFFGFGVAGIAMIGAGLALFFAGIIQISVPFIGLILCGSGLIILGIGMLFTLFSTLLCKKVLPAMVRGFVNICRLPFKNRSVTV